MPFFLHRIISKLMVKPFLWATMRERQNVVTRGIRATWRAI